jgi:hypothetical protein
MAPESPDFNTQVSIVGQQGGVASAQETAARDGSATQVTVEQQLPPGGSVTIPSVQQAVSLPAVFEVVFMASFDTQVDDCITRLQADANGDGTIDQESVATPRSSPIEFTPGVLIPPTAIIDLTLENFGSVTTTIAAQTIVREL